MVSPYPSLTLLLVAFEVVFAASRGKVLQSTRQTLPASAPENQLLLHLEELPVRDTFSTAGDAFEQNDAVYPHLEKMIAKPYFSTYKVDLSDKRCPFDDDTATCGNRQCAIEPLSSQDLDERVFEQQYLGRLRKDSVSTEAPRGAGIVEDCAPESASLYAYDDGVHNYCYPEDESAESNGVWVDLRDNIERYTGYSGPHARLMWSKVYAENCFGYSGESPPSMFDDRSEAERVFASSAADRLADVMAHPLHRRQQQDQQQQKQEMEALVGEQQPLSVPPFEDCVEQRLFYRLLSGMHASISTHLSYDWLNSTSGEWVHNLGEWLDRVGWHEDRLNNLFFDYVLMSRAVEKLTQLYERQLVFSTTCQAVDSDVRVGLRRLGRLLRSSPLHGAIDEERLFATREGRALKHEFRQRVRNVNALMSCVGCERCRLWGKIQTAGYGTALKILFELPADPLADEERAAEVLSTFRRSELVALINTFARISHSVQAVEVFQHVAEGKLINRGSLSYQWRLAWRDTKAALKFIFWSYIEFPKNLFRIVMVRLHIYWARFVATEQPYVELEDLDAGFHTEL